MDLNPGTRVDRYEVEGLLGAGGLASVYRVRHVDLDAPRAMKVLHVGSETQLLRLRREGRLQAQLHHAGIVQVTDVVRLDSGIALIMELVEGCTLGDWLAREQPDLDERLRIFGLILLAVGHAHQHGIVHRDLKPDNVLLSRHADGWRPKVADFGLARALEEPGPRATRTGVGMGTPRFMAPEQIRDASRADHRADIFALGCILYVLACDRDAFEGPTHVHIWSDILAGRLIDPAQAMPDLPGPVAAAIRACLRQEPDHRPQSCDRLQAILDGADPPEPAPPSSAHDADATFDPDLLEGTVSPPDRPESTMAPPASQTLSPPLASLAPLPVLIPEPPPPTAPDPPRGRPAWLVPTTALALVLGGGGLWWAGHDDEPVAAPAAERAPAAALEQTQGAAEPPAQQAAPASVELGVEEPSSEGSAGRGQARPEAPGRADGQPQPRPTAEAASGEDGARHEGPAAVLPDPPVSVVIEERSDRAAPAAPVATVRVSGDGDVSVRHVDTGQRYPPGPVPAGRYEVEVRFGKNHSSGFPFTAVGGEVVTLSCSATTEVCRKL